MSPDVLPDFALASTIKIRSSSGIAPKCLVAGVRPLGQSRALGVAARSGIGARRNGVVRLAAGNTAQIESFCGAALPGTLARPLPRPFTTTRDRYSSRDYPRAGVPALK